MQPDLCYRILEIEPGASKDDVKQAYKDLAKVWHPDRFSNDLRLQQKAEEKLKQINSAYEFLKSYKPQNIQNQFYKPQNVQNSTKSPQKQQEQPTVVLPNCEKLEKLLKLGNLKEADQETKRLLLELAKREKDGWLRPEDVKGFAAQALSAIDQPWSKHSNGYFGFSAQRRIWHKLGCKSSGNTFTQTVSENQFGQTVH
ncbi:GUN4 domain-containing protein [Leptolyngbya sp. FACHB-671]|uniref:GUN4 domain-containing protein n=1 Tax=Leptolyngbya sp. FACHB-671 TaxID=2692812 RepID=UPI001682B2AC|nr:GUN4 domain-containing protein [Leptolyngbya sp. FACHB-671]MBD2067488.1 GUN4 domain-containing protein [Leptolyngbya sp. FACHB-671]